MGEGTARWIGLTVVAAVGTERWSDTCRRLEDLLGEKDGERLDGIAARIAGVPAAERDAARLAELPALEEYVETCLREKPTNAPTSTRQVRLLSLVDGLTGPAEHWRASVLEPEGIARVLDSAPAGNQRDYALILDAALREIPRRWSRMGGVGTWLVTVPAVGDEVRIERPGQLAGYHYAGDIHRGGAFRGDVDAALGTNRCVALLYGNTWANWRLPFMRSRDSAVIVLGRHRSGDWLEVGLRFAVHRRITRHLQFLPGTVQVVAGRLGHSPAP